MIKCVYEQPPNQSWIHLMSWEIDDTDIARRISVVKQCKEKWVRQSTQIRQRMAEANGLCSCGAVGRDKRKSDRVKIIHNKSRRAWDYILKESFFGAFNHKNTEHL